MEKDRPNPWKRPHTDDTGSLLQLGRAQPATSAAVSQYDPQPSSALEFDPPKSPKRPRTDDTGSLPQRGRSRSASPAVDFHRRRAGHTLLAGSPQGSRFASPIPIYSNLSPNLRTLRLSQIPTSVDEQQLRQYLACLKGEGGVADDNILAFSLAPYRNWQVATVMFRQQPMDLTQASGGISHVRLPLEMTQMNAVPMEVDSEFDGITPLYHPPQSEPEYDVIAVCGLSAHAFGTWKSTHHPHVMWLRDFLPLDFPNFRVLIWGYDSDLKDPTATRNISSFSRKLLLAVQGAREQARHRPIIFVGHSLGGLVIKQALVDAGQSGSPDDKAILSSCRGLYLFGVPNRGLNNENMLSLVKDMKSEPFVHSLMEGSELLSNLGYSFERVYETLMKSCYVVSFYEEKDTKTIEKAAGKWERTGKPIRMVSQESATCFISAKDTHNHIPISANHSSMVKFTSRGDPNYLAVCTKINEMLRISNMLPVSNVLQVSNVVHSLVSALDRAGTNGFMQMLAEHDQGYKSQIPALDPEDPKYFWITKNVDFKEWWNGDSFRTLHLSGAPDGEMLKISSYVIGMAGPALYFCCPAAPKHQIWKICIQALLHQVLKPLSHPEQIQAIKEFIHQLFDAIGGDESVLNELSLEHGDREVSTIRRLLGVSTDKALLDALHTVQEIHPAPKVFIDRLDRVQDGNSVLVRPIHEFIERSGGKALLTSVTQDDRKPSLEGMRCIEYDAERKEFLDSLRFDNTRYRKITGECDGSLNWLWTHEQYCKWSTSDSSGLLYIKGKPGSGKSTVTKYFKDQLFEHQPAAKSATVASFFYSYREGESQTSHYSMLRSILHGIVSQDASFFYHIQSEYRKCRIHTSIELLYDSLQKILRGLRNYQSNTQLYLIIDAVDESTSEDRRKILELLFDVCSASDCIVKIFVASRPVVELEHLTIVRKETACSVIQMQDVNRDDIGLFVHSFLSKLDLPRNTSSDIMKYVLDNAQGVFLWVRLVGDRLVEFAEGGFKTIKIFEFLKSLPTELEDMYAFLLNELREKEEDYSVGKEMYTWVLYARRPLTVIELQHALAIQDCASDSGTSFAESLIVNFDRRITKCGRNLLETKGHEEPIVQVMHQTVREFFLSVRRDVSFGFLQNAHDVHAMISRSCLRYLILCAKETPFPEARSNLKSWKPSHFEAYVGHLNQRPLINYALDHLKGHIDNCIETDFTELVYELCEQLTGNATYCLLESWIPSHLNGSLAPQKGMPSPRNFRNRLLHTATQLKYSRVVEALIIAGAEIEASIQGKRPLLVSAGLGDETTVRLLRKLGAGIESKDAKKRTALHHAASSGHDSTVRTLVETLDANKEVLDKEKQTALHHAAANGHNSTIRMLIETLGANKEAVDGDERTALHHAAANGRDTTVRMLVETLEANKEAVDRNGRTALHYAASSGHNSTVRTLIETLHANKEALDGRERTPLHHAALNGHDSTVRMFIENLDANKEAVDRNGRTVLHLAASNGHDTTLCMLAKTLGTGTADANGNTALHFAAIRGHETTVNILVSKFGVNKDAEGYRRNTALHYATAFAKTGTVQLLFNTLQVNNEGKNAKGKTALDIGRELRDQLDLDDRNYFFRDFCNRSYRDLLLDLLGFCNDNDLYGDGNDGNDNRDDRDLVNRFYQIIRCLERT